MAKLLNVNEMLDVLIALEHPAAESLKARLVAVAGAMGRFLEEALNVKLSDPEFEHSSMGGTGCWFRPAFEGQEQPPVLIPFDGHEHIENPHTNWDDGVGPQP